ncbi:MAG: GGDEF domain-containing protein [Candidatus Cloacimonetes bacterium]|nr:GGDEF domain-containing protein [Candidatus Cloacimonadota bacterium]
MFKETTLEALISGSRKVWNLKDWLDTTGDFIVEDIASHTDDKNILQNFDFSLSFMDIYYRALTKHLANNETIFNSCRSLLILLDISEHLLAEEYLGKIVRMFGAKSENLNINFTLYLKSQITLEKLEYRESNDYFLQTLRDMVGKTTFNERFYLYLEWCNLFTKAKYYDITERILVEARKIIPSNSSMVYSKIINQYFLINRNTPEIAMNYCAELLNCPIETLNFNEWYDVYLFCGEYYTTRKNYEKAILSFSTSNSFFIDKWRQYVEKINSLQDFIPRTDYLEIKERLENKILELVSDYHLHYTFLLNSLKSAYDEVKELSNKNFNLAFADTLTGLNNRRYLHEQFEVLMESAIADGVPLSCLFIDLDNLKQINDKFGHNLGDVSILWASDMIKGYFKRSDIIVRYGGDEIVVILYETNKKIAKNLAEKIRKAIEKKVITVHEGQEIKITISVGVSEADPSELNDINLLDKLIREADKLCYIAKRKGRNRVVISADEDVNQKDDNG